MISTIPFAGFYESYHSMNVDNAIENLARDYDGNLMHEVHDELQSKCDYREVYKLYAKDYTETLAHELKLQITHESMTSPREYNFSTDRIFVEISLEEVTRIYGLTNKAELAKLVKDRFTSRSGFSSFYSPNLNEWGTDLSVWDHNEVGTLLEAYLIQEGWDDDSLHSDLVEHCNGELEQWIAAATPNFSEIMAPAMATWPTDNRNSGNLNLFEENTQ